MSQVFLRFFWGIFYQIIGQIDATADTEADIYGDGDTAGFTHAEGASFGSGGGTPPWFDGGEYVLRGGMPDAWVLKRIDPVPLPLPMIFEPERKDDPNDIEPGEDGAPADLEDAYLHSTDILALSTITAMPLQYAAAEEWSDALVAYVTIPNAELGWWTDRYAAFTVDK